MAASMSKYESWLTERLLNLNPDTDTDVFVSYITGILEEDVPNDEKSESLLDIIGQVVNLKAVILKQAAQQNHSRTGGREDVRQELLKKLDEMSSDNGATQQIQEDNIEDACQELLRKWDEMSSDNGATQQSQDTEKLTEHLSSILQQQKIEAVKPKEKSAEEVARKQAILDHYQQVSSGEEDEDGGTDDPGGQGDDLLEFKNTNADLVKKIEQEKKEKSKVEAEKKKERDKQEREAQKQKQKDRKDQEKKRTQKGERKR